MAIHIRPATQDDSGPACDVLHRSIMECCTADHRGDATALKAWLSNKTPEQVRRWILSNDHHAVTALVDGRTTGFALSSKAGEVLLNYLVPEVRFMGAGKAMLAAIETMARAEGTRALRLDSTRTALSFYRRNGFVAYGRPIQAFGMESYPMQKVLTGTDLAGSSSTTAS